MAMQFRKLRLTGFKSFVEPAELLIEPGLTGVVGPNGCGKSNLLEAIRWVMGEASPKSLRGGGMEDVIFAGTERRAPRSFAEVSLLVEDGAAETEVVRRIERGAGSAYRINGRDVRARDVTLVFADAATGAHSPALVSQGRIAAVIAARPTERRQMLEEAAGIAGLHVRRREAEQRLRGTEANLERIDQLLGDMEARTATLRRQARAAERYRTLSTAIRLAEARTLYARWREAAAAAEAAARGASAAEARVAAAGEAQRLAGEAAEAAAGTLALGRRAAEAARDAAQAVTARLAAAEVERDRLAARLADLARSEAALARDRAGEDGLAIEAAAAIAAQEAEEAAATAALREAEARRAPAFTTVAAAEQAAQASEVALAQALARQSAEQAEQRVAAAAEAAAGQRLARATAETARIASEAARLADPAPLEAARAAAAERRSAAAAAGCEAEAARAEAEAGRTAAAAAREAAESAAAAARAALIALEAEEKALVRATAGPGAALPVRVAPGYERALAAVLDGDLDAPVAATGVRRWQGAAIDPSDPPLPPGLAPLADHVTVPEALARRMAQIAVVEADDGRPLAVGQRLVTLAGAVRRWDGFVAERAGAAAAERLVRANRLEAIAAALPRARTEAAEAAGAVQAAVAALGECSARIEAARRAQLTAEQAGREAARAEDQAALAIDRLAGQRAGLDERRGRAAAEEGEARREAAAAGAALAALPDAAATRGAVEALRRETEAARGALAAARAAADGVTRAIGEAQRRIQAARGEVRGWRARAGDAARRIAEMDRRLAETRAEAAALAGRPEQAAQAVAALAAEAADARVADAAARDAERAGEAAAAAARLRQTQAIEALAVVREARATAAAEADHAARERTALSAQAGERFGGPAAVLPEKAGFAAAEVGPAADEGRAHDRLAAERERLGAVNLVAERELAEIEGERGRTVAERAELGEAVARLRQSIHSLNREGRQRLVAAFEAVDGHFRRLFTTLFAGGEAHLALIDADDPLEAGLEIMAQPPGKRLGSLTLLSGGEQALTAVALVFALFLTSPAPICVLDEVDAPLDDANIERFCDLLDRMAAETATRYLIVTHNAVTMSRMHRLFGVTMVERGVSQLVSVDLAAATRVVS